MILRGFSGLEPATVFELCSTVYGYKLVLPKFNSVYYRNFPTVRVCKLWNSLSKGIMNTPSIDAFKIKLDKIVSGLFR